MRGSDPAPAPRRRLSREQRRRQLLEIGQEMVAASSFDELSVEDVADTAGISRGLLFHYFDSRADYLVAIAQAAADELVAATHTDPDAPAEERLRQGLEAYVDYVSSRSGAYRSLVRGAAGGEARLRTVYEDALERIAQRTMDEVTDAGIPLDARGRAAIRGWTAFVEQVTVTWLERPELTRGELLDLCQDCLWSLLVGAGTATRAPDPAAG